MNNSSDSAPSTRSSGRSDALAEQEKAAIENTREGYGSTVKSRFISGKPDTDTGGPGSNNEQGLSPESGTASSPRRAP